MELRTLCANVYCYMAQSDYSFPQFRVLSGSPFEHILNATQNPNSLAVQIYLSERRSTHVWYVHIWWHKRSLYATRTQYVYYYYYYVNLLSKIFLYRYIRSGAYMIFRCLLFYRKKDWLLFILIYSYMYIFERSQAKWAFDLLHTMKTNSKR